MDGLGAAVDAAATVARAELVGSTIEWRLYINERFTGVTVRSDSQYPNMWRIHADGRMSDMVNLSRAKDAAIAWARPRGLGGEEVARWKASGKADAAPLVRKSGAA